MNPLGKRDYYNIALSENKEIGYSQIFVSGANSIDLIERVESKNGTYTFEKLTKTIYNNTASPMTDHIIHMGKGSNYLVFKEEND
jgi:hypothetical protein